MGPPENDGRRPDTPERNPAVGASLEAAGDEAARIALLMDFDRSLKQRAINPGTSADLTVASLLVQSLRFNLHKGSVDG